MLIITALLITLGISSLLVIQNSLMKDDMELMAYEKLTQDIRQVRRNILYDNEDRPYIEPKFFERDEDSDGNENVILFLQSKEGEILSGSAPEGYEYNPEISKKKVVHISVGKDAYFAVIKKGRSDSEPLDKKSGYKICAMVLVKEIEYNYRDLIYKSYSVILLVLVAFVISAFVLKKLVAAPVSELNRFIVKSVDNLDFTEKMKYDGPFSELDMLVEANNNLYDRVQQELERQEEFSANVSHELRTPVAVMHAQCQLSREIAEKNNDHEMLQSIEVFERQTDKMKSLIEQILQMSVLERGDGKFSVEDVNLLDVVESVCDDAEYICKKNIIFRHDFTSTIIRANMNLIVIVVNNLVSNAIKYSDDGGVVEVSCGAKEGLCYISVRDEGRGISPEQKTRIFESFYRADSVRNAEGFGLGLAQVLKIARYYGGTVKVDSEVGKGSTFTFEIPVDGVPNQE